MAVTAPEELLANRYVAAFYEWMGMENPNELITAIAIGIVIVYLAKNAFIIFMNNMQYRFSYYGKREDAGSSDEVLYQQGLYVFPEP